jgi:hypothetical protein
MPRPFSPSFMHEWLAAMREERIASLEDALTQLEQSEQAQTGLHNLCPERRSLVSD